MDVSRRNFLKMSGMTALGLGIGTAVGWSGARVVQAAGTSTTPELHVLNRLTWGIRPEDIAAIQQMGIEGYIDWQLNPETIADPIIDELLNRETFISMERPDLSRALDADEDYSIEARFMWARIYRAAYSERQLHEALVEFWTDHFNVPIGDLLGEKIIDDREVVRKHALGKFRDLLFASAQSPAMLYYLNQASSDKEHPNENYAREVMELHTLGVDGGYTEDDVKAVARALTGWTVNDAWRGGFIFNMEMHDTDEKTILGMNLPAGRGVEDGLQVLDLLATHPSTARFVSMKLIRRFVSDSPPQTLIDSTTAVFLGTDGDIRRVMRHILTSPEFMDSAGQKFRRPIDLMAAMLRALRSGLTIEAGVPWLFWNLESMGQLPFYWHPPNGYPDAAGAWINTNALLNRWNLAMLMPFAAEDWVEEISLDWDLLIPQTETIGELVDAAAVVILGGALNDVDRTAVLASIADDTNPYEAVDRDTREYYLPTLVGVLMSSPYFQWH
ncbi:MAG: DUF1800 domain-containing protein [Chitinophagaceae bacterium]|nr:DUF1800 domain-containing protein [Anaerolineae bacterium]